MTLIPDESVEDRQGLLAQDDHMHGMERIEMVVQEIARPFPSVARVTGRIAPSDPAPWRRPNVAVRLEVETPEGKRPVSRVYTVRAFDERRSLVEIDIVIRPHDSPAMRWLGRARAGTAVHLVGPRAHFLPHHAAGRRAALFADETAIPAVYAILRHWPEGALGDVYVESPDRAAFDELPRPTGVTCHLLLRGPGEAAGTTGRLIAAATALPNPETWTVWAAGERSMVRAIDQHFRGRPGLAQEDVREDLRVMGYWKRGVSTSAIDRARLKHYEALRARGEGLAQFEDADVRP